MRYLNAFWDGDEMTFGDGDGDGKIFTSLANSLDGVGPRTHLRRDSVR
ncbi:hypothetical protein [Thermoleptolyngbya sp.]